MNLSCVAPILFDDRGHEAEYVSLRRMDFLIGGIAAMCAGVFSNPFDVIKTRQQLQGELQQHMKNVKQPYGSQWQAIKSIVRAEGATGLQKGDYK